MIYCLIKSFFNLLFRLAVVGILIKSSLDIISTNEQTPRVLVKRTKYMMEAFRDNLGIHIEQGVLRYVMKNQDEISLVYAYIMLALSSLVAFNFRFAAKPLIWFVLLSMGFFYLELNQPYLVSKSQLEEIIMLTAVIAGLFMIDSEGHHRHPGRHIINEKKGKAEKDKKVNSQEGDRQNQRKKKGPKEPQQQQQQQHQNANQGQGKKKKNKK